METNKNLITCHNCPHKKETNHWSSDEFDSMCDWICGAVVDCYDRPTLIADQVEWYDERHVKVPEWCPINRKIVIKGVTPPQLPNRFTENDLRAAFEAGNKSREAEYCLNINYHVTINYRTIQTFEDWLRQYKENHQ